MITLTIDGQTIQAQPGTTVLETALANGIHIPHLCYHPELSIAGNCRLCIVEVEGWPNPTTSCTLECQDGMSIRTQSELLTEMRRDLISLLFSDHPLDCVTCENCGSCDLQKYAYEYGVSETNYSPELARALYQDDNPFFIRDHKYCIMCVRCVRVCDEVVGASAIDIAERGFHNHIATPFDCDMIDSTCVFCGNCVQVCPTNALMPVSRMGKGREWEFDRVKTICGYCGVGCEIEYAVKDGEIVYAQGTPEGVVNGEMLCSKGRFGWDFAASPDRLDRPLIRRDLAHELGLIDEAWILPAGSPLDVDPKDALDYFVPVEWDTALDVVASKLAGTVKAHGPDAVMGLSSARCTNEDNYIFQKLMRLGIGTNNVDHCARL